METEITSFNRFFYEVLSDMEDLARNQICEAEDDDDRKLLAFCKFLTDKLALMNVNALFADNLLDFCSRLSPDEEDILFWDLAVPFHESWVDVLNDEEMINTAEQRMEAYSLCMASEMIIRILDEYLGYGYFDTDEDMIEEEAEK